MINLLVLSIVVIIISYIFIGKYIEVIKNKWIQPFLEIGPKHSQKIGTPTMGGVSFVLIFFVFVLITIVLFNLGGLNISYYQVLIILVGTLGFFLIGFKDDLSKIKNNQNEKGLTPGQKLALQLLVSILIVGLLLAGHHSTNINFYLLGTTYNFGYFYYLLVPFLLLAISNATNLTDGLDGLLTFNACITIIFLTIIAFLLGNMEIIVSNTIFVSTLIAFYVYNKNPAKIFMGDTGSLAIGAYIAVEAILLKIEILIFFFVFIYFIETLSVILQVTYFKYTKKKFGTGRRLLLMAPLHHHLEKKNISEKKIVYIFGLINIMFCLIGLIIYI